MSKLSCFIISENYFIVSVLDILCVHNIHILHILQSKGEQLMPLTFQY